MSVDRFYGFRGESPRATDATEIPADAIVCADTAELCEHVITSLFAVTTPPPPAHGKDPIPPLGEFIVSVVPSDAAVARSLDPRCVVLPHVN